MAIHIESQGRCIGGQPGIKGPTAERNMTREPEPANLPVVCNYLPDKSLRKPTLPIRRSP